MKNIILIFAAIFLIFLVAFNKQETGQNQKLVIGAILPMTGPTALWGEQMLLGMNTAIADLELEGMLSLVVEDSQNNPAQGLSAFNKLISVDGANMILSTFSGVSFPLIKVAEERQVPLLLTLVASNSAIQPDYKYTFRFFHKANQTGVAHFDYFKGAGVKKLGIVYLNDEYGVSARDTITENARINKIDYVEDSYNPGSNDFRSQILKIKTENIDAVLFVTIPPSALKSFISQARELGVTVPIVDVGGIIPGAGGIGAVGSESEGILTSATLFDVNLSGENLRDRFPDKNLSYAFSYGYDLISMINVSILKGSSFEKEYIVNALEGIESFSGLNGAYSMNYHDMNPRILPAFVDQGILKKLEL